MAKLFLKPALDVVKTAISAAGPIIGFINVGVQAGTIYGLGPVQGVVYAVSTVAEECTPPAVYFLKKLTHPY